MFKFSSQKTLLVFLIILMGILSSVEAARPRSLKNSASIEYIIDEQNMMASSDSPDWNVGEILPIISQNAKIGVFAYTELVSVKYRSPGRYELKLKLLRQARRYLVQQGDYVKRLNLETANEDYVGTTELLVKETTTGVSARYKPLVYQGLFIGETAQTLYQGEFLINFIGNTYYGITEDLMVNSLLSADFLSGLNGGFKYRVYDSESATVSTGLSYVQIRGDIAGSGNETLNFNLYWDNNSSSSLISHTNLSLGVFKKVDSGEIVTFKALTSSFQTGYEVIRSNWDRVSIGPNFNFTSKTIGGYVAYFFIFDTFHLQIAINTTNITQDRLGKEDGYYGYVDLYWRF